MHARDDLLTRPRRLTKRVAGRNGLLDRTPPHSVEEEQGLLGSILLDSKSLIECERKITSEYFYVPAHKTIYETSREMEDAGKAIDLITVTNYLRDAGNLEGVGGAVFVTGLFTLVPIFGADRK